MWRKAVIVLILESLKDRKYWITLNTIIEHFNLPIDTWSVGKASCISNDSQQRTLSCFLSRLLGLRKRFPIACL
jgi:hypothetical protein